MMIAGSDGIVMNMRKNLLVALGLILSGAGSASAGIDTGPVIAVPGRRGVPIMMYGRDVRGAVIEGDWGLGRAPGDITIMWPRLWANPRFHRASRRHVARPKPHTCSCMCCPRLEGYFPATGRQPRVGRDEVIPPPDRPLPPPAEEYRRGWWSESPDLPISSGPLWYFSPLMGVDVDWYSRRHGPRQEPDR
jgi:hypothetical protein